MLTGGASRRMGRNKALVEIDGVPMAASVAEALRSAGCDPVVAYGGDADELDVLGLAVVPDRYPGAGPLGGVLGVLERFETVDESDTALVVVAACDLPALRGVDVEPLIDAARRDRRLDVVVARTDRLEPACAVWRVSSAPTIRRLFDGGVRALHEAIEQLHSTEIAVSPSALANINTPGDLGGYP